MISEIVKKNAMIDKSTYLSFDSKMVYYIQKMIFLTEKIMFLWRFKG